MGNNCNTWWQKMGWFTVKTPMEFYEFGDAELARQRKDGKNVSGRLEALANAGFCIDFDYNKLIQNAPQSPSILWTSCEGGNGKHVEAHIKDNDFYFSLTTVPLKQGVWVGGHESISVNFENVESSLDRTVSTFYAKYDYDRAKYNSKSGKGFEDFCGQGLGGKLQEWYDGGMQCFVEFNATAKFVTLIDFVKGVEELICR